MSLTIAGVGVGAALATGAATAVGGYAVGQLLKPGSSGASGTSATTSGTAANAADPFAGQRGSYQTALNTFMADPNSVVSDPYGAAQMLPNQTPATSIPQVTGGAAVPSSTTTGSQMMSDMLTPGYQFNSTDPSYAWRLQQGAAALTSSNAANGLLNSGSAATALLNYGQNQASTEYQAQFARAQAQNSAQEANNQQTFADQTTNLNNQFSQQQQQFSDSNTLFTQQQQQFSNLMGLDSQYTTNESNQYSRLAQLAGANIGNPGVAGQLQQQGTTAAAAGLTQIAQPVVSSLSNAFGGLFNSGSGSGNANGNTNVANANNTDAYGDSLSMYGAGGSADGVTPEL